MYATFHRPIPFNRQEPFSILDGPGSDAQTGGMQIVPRRHCFWLVLICAIVTASTAVASEYEVVVRSGSLDRKNALVEFALPELGASYELRSADGRRVPLQTDYLGRATVLLAELPRDQERVFDLAISTDAEANPAVQAVITNGTVRLQTLDKPVVVYQGTPSDPPRPGINPLFRRGGYLHPVFSPSGKLVTDDYPPNHIHHHGIWFPWTKTQFEGRSPDFWNMGQGLGRVEFVSLEKTWSGPVHGGFTARHRFVDLTAEPAPKPALDEFWDVRVYKPGTDARPYWVFDLVSRQECATSSPLVLPKYHYGGLGVRGNWAWNGKENTDFLTSDGITDRVQGNETRGRWCYMGGLVDGQRTGIAILCHPENFRFPQPMRLHPSEPFFCFAPAQLGDWVIEPGKPYISRYRFVLLDGEPDPALLERLWNDYANPPEVIVQRKGS